MGKQVEILEHEPKMGSRLCKRLLVGVDGTISIIGSYDNICK